MHPVLIQVGPFSLATYGVLVAAGYVAGISWLKVRINEMPGMTEQKFWTLIYALFFGAVAGGKLLYLLVALPEIAAGRVSLLGDIRYGFVFFGGLLGAMAMGVWAARRLSLPYLATADYFGVALPLGHAIGRVGCLMAGCCYGKSTTLPWGIRLEWGVLHPVQLYESAANLAIAALAWKALLPRAKKGALAPGSVFLAYGVLYSAARFVVEFFRGDDRGWRAGGLWVSQWISLLFIAAGSAVWLTRARRTA